MRILLVIVSMVLASCGIQESKDSIYKTVEANHAAIEAVKSIDSYYLVPCRRPQIATTSDESIDQVLNHIDQLMVDYSDCYKRHNSLIEQVK